jgi:hypothetical protein
MKFVIGLDQVYVSFFNKVFTSKFKKLCFDGKVPSE